MLKITTYILLSSIMSQVYAQEIKDYGGLIPGKKFTMTHSKTDLNDLNSAANYKIDKKKDKEFFTYHEIQKGPNGKNLKASKKESSLIVEKKDGKVVRASNLTFIGDVEKGTSNAMEQLTTFTLENDGSLNSHTICQQFYAVGFLGKENELSDYQCMTLSEKVCEEVNKIEKKAKLKKDMQQCKDSLVSYTKDMETLALAAGKDHKRDIDVLKGFGSGLGRNYKNAFDVSKEEALPITRLLQAHEKAQANCKFLKENGYFEKDKSPNKKKVEVAPGSSVQ